jgi:hypothetical protein
VLFGGNNPTIAPGASFRLDFPQLQKTLEGRQPSMSVKLPDAYSKDKRYPLFLWLGGGRGGSGHARTDIVDPNRYICIGMPLFRNMKKVQTEKDQISKMHVRYEDAKIAWAAYSVMLARLEKLVPNIEKKKGVSAGFSNGAHMISILMTKESKNFSQYFSAFIFVEGGYMYKKKATFGKSPIIALGGDGSWGKQKMGWDGSGYRTASSLIKKNTKKQYGKSVIMKQTGHSFNTTYIPEIVTFLKQHGY